MTYFGLTCHNGLNSAPGGGLPDGLGTAVFLTAQGQDALVWSTTDVPLLTVSVHDGVALMSPVYPFDDSATARAVVDERGTLTGWNEGARRLLGWSAAEMLGRPAASLLVDDGTDGPAQPAEDIWHGTLALRHRDGLTVSSWLLAHHRPAPDGGGGDWLVVTPLENDAPPADDPLMRAALAQAPVRRPSTTTGCGCTVSTTSWPVSSGCRWSASVGSESPR